MINNKMVDLFRNPFFTVSLKWFRQNNVLQGYHFKFSGQNYIFFGSILLENC